MMRGSGDEAMKLFLSLNENMTLRDIREEWDYGPSDTTFIKLRRTWVSFTKCNPQTSYGMYLGFNGDKYVVGVRDLLSEDLHFTFCEYFDTLDECKDEWMADII